MQRIPTVCSAGLLMVLALPFVDLLLSNYLEEAARLSANDGDYKNGKFSIISPNSQLRFLLRVLAPHSRGSRLAERK